MSVEEIRSSRQNEHLINRTEQLNSHIVHILYLRNGSTVALESHLSFHFLIYLPSPNMLKLPNVSSFIAFNQPWDPCPRSSTQA